MAFFDIAKPPNFFGLVLIVKSKTKLWENNEDSFEIGSCLGVGIKESRDFLNLPCLQINSLF